MSKEGMRECKKRPIIRRKRPMIWQKRPTDTSIPGQRRPGAEGGMRKCQKRPIRRQKRPTDTIAYLRS